MLSACGLLLSYAGASAAIYLALARFVRVQSRALALLLCIGLGPIAISRVLVVCYRLLPGLDDFAYVWLCIAAFVAIGAYGARTIPLTAFGAPIVTAARLRRLALIVGVLLV